MEDLAKSYQEVASEVPKVGKTKNMSTRSVCLHCNTWAYYGNCETKRRFCRAHMDPELHWRISFCDKAKCENVATSVYQGVQMCSLHAYSFNSNVTSSELSNLSCLHSNEFVTLDANPLEKLVENALFTEL